MQPGGGGGIDGGETGVERFGAFAPGGLVQSSAEIPVSFGTIEQSAEKRAEVESAAADEQRQGATVEDAADGYFRGGDVRRDGELLTRVDEVEEMMREIGSVCGCRFGGPDVEVTIEGHRIEGDDLDRAARGSKGAGESQREVALARGGGSDEESGFAEEVTVEPHGGNTPDRARFIPGNRGELVGHIRDA